MVSHAFVEEERFVLNVEMDKRVKYETFVKAFIEAYPSLRKAEQYSKAQELWNKSKEDDEKLNNEFLQLKSKAFEVKSRNLKSFFKPTSSSKKKNPPLTEKMVDGSDTVVSDGTSLNEEDNTTRGLSITLFIKSFRCEMN